VKIIYRKVYPGPLVFHDVYPPEYRPNGIIDYLPPFFLDDHRVNSQRLAVQGMFKDKDQALPVRVQNQPDNVAEGGVPGDRFLFRFIFSVCDGAILLNSTIHINTGIGNSSKYPVLYLAPFEEIRRPPRLRGEGTPRPYSSAGDVIALFIVFVYNKDKEYRKFAYRRVRTGGLELLCRKNTIFLLVLLWMI
jgi:hypothetical protein